MAPAVLAALIGAGSSVVGGAAANIFGARNADKANALNYRMMQEQNAFTGRMQDKAMAYNTPLQQRLRYQEAGINPALALSNISAGNIESLTSAAAQPAQSRPYQDMIAPAGAQISQGLMAQQQFDLQAKSVQADIDNKTADTVAKLTSNKYLDAKSKADLAESAARTNASQALADKALVDAAATRSLTPVQREELQARKDQALAQTDLLRLQSSLARYDFGLKSAQIKMLNAQAVNLAQSTVYLAQQGVLSARQADLVSAQKLKAILEAQGVSLSNERVKRGMDAYLQILGYQVRQASADADRSEKSNDWYHVDKVMDTLESVMGIATDAVALYSGIPLPSKGKGASPALVPASSPGVSVRY